MSSDYEMTRNESAARSSNDLQSSCNFFAVKFERRSEATRLPILQQNANGPCPLLAIMNLMLLRGNVKLDEAKIISGAIAQDYVVEAILERTMQMKSLAVQQPISDVLKQEIDEMMFEFRQLIPSLASGMDVNCYFSDCNSFEYCRETALLDLLDIPLRHGWVAPNEESVAVPPFFGPLNELSYNAAMDCLAQHAETKALLHDIAAAALEHFTRTDMSTPADDMNHERDNVVDPADDVHHHNTSSTTYGPTILNPSACSVERTEATAVEEQECADPSCPPNSDVREEKHRQNSEADKTDLVMPPSSSVSVETQFALRETLSIEPACNAVETCGIFPSSPYNEFAFAFILETVQNELMKIPAMSEMLAAEVALSAASIIHTSSELEKAKLSDLLQQLIKVVSEAADRHHQVVQFAEFMTDAGRIKDFIEKSSNQMTDFGFLQLHESLCEDQFAVLFRNCHFTVILKKRGRLYQLVTDIGFAKSDILWERLDDIAGNLEYFDANFQLVSALQRPVQQRPAAVMNPGKIKQDSRLQSVVSTKNNKRKKKCRMM